jgi:hypothetical protein
LQQYGNSLSQASGQGGQSATTTYGPPTNWATGLLGAGSAAYGLFGGGS